MNPIVKAIADNAKRVSGLATKAKDFYGETKVSRHAARIKHAEDGVEAAKKGLFALTKHKAKGTFKTAGTIANVGFTGLAMYETAKAFKDHGIKEAGKVALNNALLIGVANLVARIPYVGPFAAGGLVAADVARGIQGKEALLNSALYSVAPGLRPMDSQEQPPTEVADDRPVEQPSPLFQEQMVMPTQRQMRRMERKQMYRDYIRKQGLEMIAQHSAQMDRGIYG